MGHKMHQEHFEEIDVQRYWLVLKRHWLPALLVLSACLSGAVFYALAREPFYEATGKIVVRPSSSTSLTGVGEGIGQLESLQPFEGSPAKTQATILTSIPVLSAATEALGLDSLSSNQTELKLLQEDLEVELVEGTDILSVTYGTTDAEFSAALVNAIMDAYLERNIIGNRAEAAAAREFIEMQIPKAVADVERASEELRRFKAQNQVIALEDQALLATRTLSDLDNSINQSRADLASATSQVSELKRQLGLSLDEAKELESLSVAPGVQQALVDLQEIQNQLATQRSLYRSNHYSVINLEQQETALQDLLENRIGQVLRSDRVVDAGDLQMSELERALAAELSASEVSRLSLDSQLQALTEARAAYQVWANNFPTLEKQQLELSQRLEAAVSSYDTLLERLQETQLAENQTIGSAEILEFASPSDDPVNSDILKFIIVGTAVGLMLGVSTAFFLDLVDRSVKTVKDGEVLLGYTPLGLIPKFDTPVNSERFTISNQVKPFSPRIAVLNQSPIMVANAYQMLQANLRFTSSDAPHRVLLIASAVAEEGKSEVCANLAASLAQSGKKVLLIDADMRKPSQHHLWGETNQYGLSHFLVGQANETQVFCDVLENLTLLPSGVVPPNPLAILDSERMVSLLQTSAKKFDYVIIDTPPLLGAADASVLGNLVDGVLMVMRPRVVSSPSALAAKAALERSGAKVIGMVANGVDIRNEHDDYVSQFKMGEYGFSYQHISEPITTKVN